MDDAVGQDATRVCAYNLQKGATVTKCRRRQQVTGTGVISSSEVVADGLKNLSQLQTRRHARRESRAGAAVLAGWLERSISTRCVWLIGIWARTPRKGGKK